MNGIASLYQMTPTGVPFRTGTRGESTSEQRYFVPGFRSIPLTPEQQADQMLAAQRKLPPYLPTADGGPGSESGAPPGSPGSPGSAPSPSLLTDAVVGLHSTMQNLQEISPLVNLAPGVMGLTTVSRAGMDALIDQEAKAAAQLKAANEQMVPSRVSYSHFNLGPQVSLDPNISVSPVPDPAMQQVTSIAPDAVMPGLPVTDQDINVDPTAALAAMNVQQTEEDTTSPAAVAADVAATVAATADAVDADAGAVSAANAAAASAATGGTGTGNDAGVGGDTSASDAAAAAAAAAAATGGTGTGNDAGTDAGSDGASNSYKYGGRVINYQQGGVASLANQVQERGRGQDTMLVHMTPREVGGLQALAMAHGGSLTINPQTGLPEAGFLSSILPMIAGAALTATGIGAPMAALLVGGGYGVATGSLSKGLMAGLGAFGGAGLGSALSAAGAAGVTAPAITGTAPGLAQAGAVVPQAAMSAAPGSFQAALPGLGVSTAGSAVAPAAMSAVPAAAPVTFANMASGIPALGTEAGRAAALQSLGGPMGAIKTAGMAASPILTGGLDEPAGLPIQEQNIRPFKYRARPASEEDEDFRYRTGERDESTAEQRYFDSKYTPLGVFRSGTEPAYGTYAMGGDIEEGVKNGNIRAFDDEYGQDEYAGGGLTAFKAGGLQDGGFVVPADVVAHLGNGSTDAGLRLLAKTLRAKPIKGKGDGMSDSIPTTIGGKQPARVADGEAYISAEVTKKIGSERLYAMMDRIRKAKTGKKKQAPEINTRNYVPA